MRRLLLSVVVFAIGLATCMETVRVQADTDATAEITALENHLINEVKAKDLDGIMSSYVSDDSLFVFDVTPPRQFEGAKAYREDWKGFLAAFNGPITAAITHLTITTDGGDLAFAYSIQHFSGVSANGKKI